MKAVVDFILFLLKGISVSFLTVIKLVILVLLILPILISKLWHCLIEILRKKNFKEIEDKEPCVLPFPEDVIRRPDPCIYSQTYLMEQSLPVTWNNPDIWVSKKVTPNIIEPDSYHLDDDTDYIVSVRVHNASVDPAIGVRVRLVYRPWSFNSPDLVPVETDASGNEVVKIVNISPMGSVVVQFNWHTPDVLPGEESRHYCIQAIPYHPMDINIKNNLGQENTLVFNQPSARLLSNERVDFTVPIFNHSGEVRKYRIKTWNYQTDEKETIELRLKSNTGRMKLNGSKKLQRMIPEVAVGLKKGRNRNWLGLEWASDIVTIKNRYIGYEDHKARLQSSSYSLPENLDLTLDGEREGFDLKPKESKELRFSIVNSKNHANATTYQITIAAVTEQKTVAGGITVIFTY